MKKIASIIVVAFLLVSVSHGQERDYKGHLINASEKILEHVVIITTDNVIQDPRGNEISYVDSEGAVVAGVTGKKLGQLKKNGDFVAYIKNTITSTVTAPEDGVCLIKDENGKIIAEIHETYKNIGACAMHMKRVEVLEKSAEGEGKYACSMHPEVTSNKKGKCSKCGMALTKKQ